MLALATTCLAANLPLDLPQGPPVNLRVPRDTPGYAPPGCFHLLDIFLICKSCHDVTTAIITFFLAPAYHPEPSYGHPKGRVGPVYTFVKTDPKVI